MGDFPAPLVNVQYQLVDNEAGDLLDESTTFVVSLESDEQSGFSGAMIGLVALLALILISIVVAVVVLSGRGGDDDDDFIEDDDFLPGRGGRAFEVPWSSESWSTRSWTTNTPVD